MEATRFPPPPTYAEPTIVDERTKKAAFNPIWLKWFLDVAQGLEDATNQLKGGLLHNALKGIQGGVAPNQIYHLTGLQAGYQLSGVLVTDGDLITMIGGVPKRFPIGSSGQVLTVVGGVPTWV